MTADEGPPTADELPGLAEKLVYEFRMWLLALGMCGQPTSEVGPRNAWLEVFLLHTRTLANFFLARPIKDDVVASHFIPGWSLTESEAAWIAKIKDTLDKSLAHLTAARTRRPQPRYSIDDIRRNILALWSRFESEAHEEQSDAARALLCLLT